MDPRGAALAPELAAEGAALDAGQARAAALIDEIEPRTTVELLADWERVAGLPDACVASAGVSQTPAQRRSALVGRLTTLGGQTQAYFVALAAALGYIVTVTEAREMTVEDDVEHPTQEQPWPFVWKVNAALNTVTELLVEDSVEDPLAWWGNALLECVLSRLRPAHTHLLFAYT